jgi:hypothetical protein
MRMRPHVEPVSRAEFRRTEVVEEDKRSDHTRAHRRERAAHRKIAKINRARDDHLGDRVALIDVAGSRIFAGKKTHGWLLYIVLSVDPEQPHSIPGGDPPRLLGGKLRKPSAIFLEDRIVAEPALIDPRVGAKQKTV